MFDHRRHFNDFLRSESLGLGIKKFALLEKSYDSDFIYITKATPGREYYHPDSLAPLSARLKHVTPHFYFKNQQDKASFDNLHPSTRIGGEGIVHMLCKKVIWQEKSLTLNVDGEPYTLRFSEVKREHIPLKPNDRWRIDLVCLIRKDSPLYERFGHGLNIEIVCHHPVDNIKEHFLKSLPYAAMIIRPFDGMLKEIEAEEARVVKQGIIAEEHLAQWERRVRGFLHKSFRKDLIYIPHERDPRAFKPPEPAINENLILPPVPKPLQISVPVLEINTQPLPNGAIEDPVLEEEIEHARSWGEWFDETIGSFVGKIIERIRRGL